MDSDARERLARIEERMKDLPQIKIDVAKIRDGLEHLKIRVAGVAVASSGLLYLAARILGL